MPIFIFLFFDSHIGPCFLLPVHESQRKPKFEQSPEDKEQPITGNTRENVRGLLFGWRSQLRRENMADEELLQFSHGCVGR